MPNWTFVDYRVVGDERELRKLYQTMKELEQRDETKEDNHFGKTWLGNLIVSLGGEPANVDCRGKWNFVEFDSCGVYFTVEVAWREPESFRRFLENRLPGIKVYFQSVGDGFWQTNDKEGLYFTRYYLYTEEMGEDYYSSLDELIAEVSRITGDTTIKSLDECDNALVRYSEENGDYEVYVGEFEIID